MRGVLSSDQCPSDQNKMERLDIKKKDYAR